MIHIFGGGTVSYVRSHLALCAPAYGNTARYLHRVLGDQGCPPGRLMLELTRMAAPQTSRLETNEDVAARLQDVLANPLTRAIVFNVALCDFQGQIGEDPSGKYAKRLRSREAQLPMRLTPADKLLRRIKEQRPDIFLVGFKTTAGDESAEQAKLALRQIDETGADLVLANDTVTRNNLLMAGGTMRGTVLMETSCRDLVLHSLATAIREAV